MKRHLTAAIEVLMAVVLFGCGNTADYTIQEKSSVSYDKSDYSSSSQTEDSSIDDSYSDDSLQLDDLSDSADSSSKDSSSLLYKSTNENNSSECETEKVVDSSSIADESSAYDYESEIAAEAVNAETTEESTYESNEDITYIGEPVTYEYYNDWLWVGDSRIVGMAGNVGITYLAKSAMGLDWFLENQQTVYDMRGYNVVFNFGINDYWNVYNYANVYNSMPEDFIENNKIFIMSVNPVDEEKGRGYGYWVYNSTIEWFNENLRINLRDDFYYMDCYSYLRRTGFGTLDGVHYDGTTNVKIYNYIIGTVTGQEF